MAETVSPEGLLRELEEPVAKLINDHMRHQRIWYPHELIRASDARDYTDSDPWRPDEYPLSDGVRSALFVNLLTEDNLPYYTNTIMGQAPKAHPINEWTRVWTAEEGRHSLAIRGWAENTRALDPYELEAGRMAQVTKGEVPEPGNILDMLAYTSFQELATLVAHRNTGSKLDKEHGGRRVMATVAGDENLHHVFYREATTAALEIDPSSTVIAIARQLRTFKMPGTGIPGFSEHAKSIEAEGIYGLEQFKDNVVAPTLRHWGLDVLTELSDEAKKALESIHTIESRLDKAINRKKRNREEKEASVA